MAHFLLVEDHDKHSRSGNPMNKSDFPEITNLRDGMKSERVDHSRRRLSRAALVTPVVASLAARPALASTQPCSVSGFMSGNTSPGRTPYTCTGYGCTPGFWKNNPEAWRVYSPGTCATRNGGGWCQQWTPGGARLSDILGTCSNPFTMVGSSEFLLDILLKGAGNGNSIKTEYADVCHYIAAILNAAASPDSYGSTVDEIQKGLCRAADQGQVNYFTTVLLAKLNERGCMFNAHGDCETRFVKNTADQCIPACPSGTSWNSTTMKCE